MTINTQVRTAGPFIGNGSATGGPFVFKIFNADEMTVVETSDIGADRSLVYGTDFDIVLNADQNAAPGGTINYLISGVGPSLIPTGYTLNATSDVSNLQPVALTNNGGFFPKVINDALDRVTILVQQLVRGVNSSLKFPLSDGLNLVSELPNKTVRASQYVAFDANGDVITLPGTDTGGNISASSVTAINTPTPRAVQNIAGDVANPQQWGALPGGSDSAAAFNAMLIQVMNSGQPADIDLGGKSYTVKTPIAYPAGSRVQIRNGTIIADASFDATKYIIQATQTGSLPHQNLTFQDLTLDANQTGGCLALDNYFRIKINGLNTIRYTTNGLILNKTSDSHECIVNNSFFSQYPFGDTPGAYTGTAINCNANDNIFTNIVASASLDGIKLNAQYNLIRNAHTYVNRHGIYATANASFSSLIGSYIDSCDILMEDPWNTEILGNKFLHNTTDTSFSFITLKPLAAGRLLNGLKINNNSFQNINAAILNPVRVDTSVGTFNNGTAQNCSMIDNSFINVNKMTTRPDGSIYNAAGATAFVFDFSTILPFGVIQRADVSFEPDSSANFRMLNWGVNGGGNARILTANLSTAANGVVCVSADINIPSISM